MPYIDKQPCKSAQVLVLQACPLHEIIHEIDDYLLYYDACYFPEIYKNCFETAETVDSWLLTELDNHKNVARLVWVVQIFTFKQRLMIKIFEFVLVLNLTSKFFTICCLAKSLRCNGKSSLFEFNPAWFTYSIILSPMKA